MSSADEELTVLRSLKARGARVDILPARKRTVREKLETGGFDIFHLVSHGEFGGVGAADASAVMLDDGPFTAAELSPRMAAALRASSPLIFFNACHTGRIGFSLTQLGSWGAEFARLGCGGFVGSLWPVTDQAAVVFARTFCEALMDGLTIGQAMLEARKRVREAYPSDPTWLAYCCYADPMATVRTEQ